MVGWLTSLSGCVTVTGRWVSGERWCWTWMGGWMWMGAKVAVCGVLRWLAGLGWGCVCLHKCLFYPCQGSAHSIVNG